MRGYTLRNCAGYELAVVVGRRKEARSSWREGSKETALAALAPTGGSRTHGMTHKRDCIHGKLEPHRQGHKRKPTFIIPHTLCQKSSGDRARRRCRVPPTGASSPVMGTTWYVVSICSYTPLQCSSPYQQLPSILPATHSTSALARS